MASSSSSPRVINRPPVRTENDGSAVGPEKQLMHLLALLGRHGPKLSHQHRAQHLVVTRSLLLSPSISASAFREIPAAIFLALSKFLGSCQIHRNPVREPDTLAALFALINAACGCLPGDEFAQNRNGDINRKSPSQLPTFARSADDGLFGGASTGISDDDDEDDAFLVSPLKLKIVRMGLRESAEEAVRASIAHLVVTACDACGDAQEHGLKVRTMALGAISAFGRVLPPNLLAVFFPGIASKLAKLLTRARLDQSILAMLAFDALSALVSRLFAPLKNDNSLHQGGASFSSILEATIHEKRLGQNPAPSPLNVSNGNGDKVTKPQSIEVSERGEHWYVEASRRFSDVLSVILESSDSPRFHPNQNARFACAKFLGTCVFRKSRIRIDAIVRAECFVVLLETAADQFAEPRELAVELIRDAIHMNSCEAAVEDGLNALIGHVLRLEISQPFAAPLDDEEDEIYGDDDGDDNGAEGEALRRMMRAQNPQHEEHEWCRLLEGYLRVLGHQNPEDKIYSPSLDILRGVNSEELAIILATFQKTVFKPAAIESPDEYQLLRNPALNACERLGKAGLLPSLQICLTRMAQRQLNNNNNNDEDDQEVSRHVDVVHHTDPETFVNHAHVVQCMHWLMVGACAQFRERYIDLRTATETDDWEQLKRYGVGVLKAAASCTLPVDEASGWFSDSVPIRAKVGTLMCTAQMLEIFGRLKTPHRKLGFEIVLPSLLALLVDAAREEAEIRNAAEHALRKLGAGLGYANTAVLIRKHVNFIVARLARNLHHTWAAAVLKYIIMSQDNNGEDNGICAQVINLAQDTLVQQCHDLAGASDYRAAITLAAIDGVLSTALIIRSNNNDDKEEEVMVRDPVQEEIDELTKHMMSFCTDDVAEEEKLEYVNEETKLDDDEEEREKSAFEIIASSALAGIEDLLIGRPAQLRAQALRVAATGIQVLSIDDTALLPCVAKLLQLIPPQLSGTEDEGSGIRKYRIRKSGSREEDAVAVIAEVNRLGRELPVISAACALMTQLVRSARAFVQGRFVKLIFPKLRPLLQLLTIRHAERCDVGFGALTAADNAMELVHQVSLCLPKAIAPFAEEITRYVIPYLNPGNGNTKNGAANAILVATEGRRYEIRRYRCRSKWADAIMRALASGPATDLVWTLLVVEDAKNNQGENEIIGKFCKLKIR